MVLIAAELSYDAGDTDSVSPAVVLTTLSTHPNAAEAFDKKQFSYADATECAKAECPSSEYAAVVGETSYGSEGFVALFDRNNSNLIWVASFVNSNPTFFAL